MWYIDSSMKTYQQDYTAYQTYALLDFNISFEKDVPEYDNMSFSVIIMNMNTLYFQIVSASGTIKTIQLHEASLVMAFNDYYQYILEERSLSKEDAFKIIDSYITQLDMLKE